MENDDRDDYDIDHHAICIVSGANLAKDPEMKRSIAYLEKIIGTGYYDDPDGDKLLQHIVDYLKSKK